MSCLRHPATYRPAHCCAYQRGQSRKYEVIIQATPGAGTQVLAHAVAAELDLRDRAKATLRWCSDMHICQQII